MSDTFSDTAAVRRGTVYGAAAYGLWALPSTCSPPRARGDPHPPHPVDAAVRIGAAGPARPRPAVVGVPHAPEALGAVTIAGLLIAGNWVIYVGAVVSHHVTEASLGYFLNPLVTVAIGVVVLRERVGCSGPPWRSASLVGGIYLTVTSSGRPPWIALGLAFTFALYGLMKKRLAPAWTPCTASPPRPRACSIAWGC